MSDFAVFLEWRRPMVHRLRGLAVTSLKLQQIQANSDIRSPVEQHGPPRSDNRLTQPVGEKGRGLVVARNAAVVDNDDAVCDRRERAQVVRDEDDGSVAAEFA